MATLTLRRWIKGAPKGQVLIYHRGLLMADRQSASAPHNYNLIAKIIWQAYERGQVLLVQRKEGNAAYVYLAIHT